MPFPFDKYPWLNFQELNLAYFIKHFREIFQQWNTLLNKMYDWKDATDAELAEWKSAVETGISSWETGLQQSMEDWKDETESDISAWEAATLSALDAWKTATTAVFEQIRTEAAASAQAAAGSASSAQTALAGAQAAQAAAEAAAAGIQSEAAQIQTNTSDISELKTQLTKLTNGCADGTEVLKSEVIYEIGDDLKTLNASSGPRTAKYENGTLTYSYIYNGSGSASIGASYVTPGGLSTDNDVWIDFDKSLNQYISYSYDLSLDGVSASTPGQNMSISFALRYKVDNDSEVYTARYSFDTSKTHEAVNMPLSTFMESILTATAYSHLTEVSLYGITSGSLTWTNGISVVLSINGVYIPAEDGENLAEKYAYVKAKAESADATATDADELANGNAHRIDALEGDIEGIDELVDGDNIISDSTYTLRQNLPSYYTSDPPDPTSFSDFAYIDSKIESIPNADKRFVFFTDSHWDHPINGRHSPELIQYVRQRKNIPNVIFGGDYIEGQGNSGDIKGKYLAKQIIEDFASKMLCTAGTSYMPVMGNHDTNMGGSLLETYGWDAFFPYSQIFKTEFSNLHKSAHTQFEFDNERIDLAQFAGNDYEEFVAYLKLSYYYDDVKYKIRYIVLNTAADEPADGPIHNIFQTGNSAPTTAFYINLPWYYNTLKTVPKDYDVVILSHEMINYESTTATLSTREVMLAMGLKTKCNRAIYLSNPSSSPRPDPVNTWCGFDGGTYFNYDFTDANDVGKIIFVCGHVHEDGIAVFSQTTGSTTINTPVIEWAADQSVVQADQNTVLTPSGGIPGGHTADEFNGCEIPVIFTARDKTETDMNGTVNEQRFDVFGLTENAIEITRIGKGDNRRITFE